MSSERLYVMARAPRPGAVKTRLARTIGAAPAAHLYAGFLRDLGARFDSAPFGRGWYVTPSDAWAEIAALLPDASGWSVREQPAGDHNQRQIHLFREAAAAGETPVVLIASDSPQLEMGVVTRAFELLGRHQLVLGPTFDGGYYLIGMRGWHDVLAEVTMSEPDVFAQVRSRAATLGLRTALLAPTFDVDEEADLAPLREAVETRSDLPATAAALAELGLARPTTTHG